MTSFTPRYPELVSGSISPRAQVKRGNAKANRKVHPVGVFVLDQIDFPLPVPVLDLLLAGDGRRHVAEDLEADEAIDFVTGCEAGNRPAPVLPEAFREVGCDADIKRPVIPAREDIDARLAFLPHGPEIEARWTLKQVQGDGFECELDLSQ